MRLTLIFFTITTLLLPGALNNDWRRLAAGDGRGVNARAVALLGEGRVLLENEAGEQFETPLEVLSSEDRSWFLEWEADWKKRAAVGKKLNAVIGQPVFLDSWRLWDEKAEVVAKRLAWRPESKTPFSSSFRRYTGADYRFLGARPYSVAAYGDDRGLLARMSLVFANKGDSFSAAGMAEDHFKEGESDTTMKKFAQMLKNDVAAVTDSLTSVLGEGEVQYFGEGNDRRRVVRWDWNGHAFILSEEDEEYVGLLIVSIEEAENRGRTDRIPDSEIKERLANNVVHEKNGDVHIKNIPMVNQGPKGYCVPATFERAMRYQGVPADMYLLAVAGGTAPGGGTNTQRLFEEVESIVRRKGRRPDDVKINPLRMRTVQRYIDEGVPIMWQMCSLSEYNAIANRRTQARKSVTDWAAYAAQIAEEAEANAKTMENVKANFHVCMIIGYNEATQELAVSDSWGARYEIRWIHIDEAAAVGNGKGFAIKR
ncbi:hypothetical protein AAFN60_20680 [Roseibacillus persicicus]|uniref:hypothetical protein n=1 Tax=Roseibacillus persicicus TaxID=454148 RepID=UPI00398A6B26